MYTTPDPDFGPPSFAGDIQTAAVIVQGYDYQYAPAAGATPQTYTVNANPTTLGRTGTRTFWVSETGQVFHCLGESAAAVISAKAVSIDQEPVGC
jgi:hypothetical protein